AARAATMLTADELRFNGKPAEADTLVLKGIEDTRSASTAMYFLAGLLRVWQDRVAKKPCLFKYRGGAMRFFNFKRMLTQWHRWSPKIKDEVSKLHFCVLLVRI